MFWKADVFQDIIVPSDFVRIKTFSGGRTMEFTNLSGLKRFLTDNLYFESTCIILKKVDS